jgi:hypothetical protein
VYGVFIMALQHIKRPSGSLARYSKGLDHGGMSSMIHEESSAPPAHPSTDDTVETHYAGLERLECALCYRGLVYIGHHELTSEGEEIEVVVAVPCKRCSR